MASLTIRKLDEGVKTYLRLRSAKNRRSVEEEVRVILRELIEGREEPLVDAGALDNRRDLHRDIGRYPSAVIAMQSNLR